MTEHATPVNITETNNTSPVDVTKAFIDNPAGRRVLYGIVGVLSILCNGALCIVVLRNKRMLRNSYNVLVLLLAIVDTITGFSIIISPSFVIGNQAMPIPSGAPGRAFCFLIQRNFFVWLLAKFSVSIVMCMAIERWYALARPIKYKTAFTTRKVLLYSSLLCGLTLLVTMPTFFQTFAETKGSKTVCVDKPLMGLILASQVFTIMYCTITAFLPFMVIAATYLHLRFYTIGQRPLPQTHEQKCHRQTHAQKTRRQAEIMLARMSAVVALVLVICIFPSQITFILFKFNIVSWDVVNVSSTLSMFNSVFNPWIYCFTNKVYREEFVKAFRPCAVKQEEPSPAPSTNNELLADTGGIPFRSPPSSKSPPRL